MRTFVDEIREQGEADGKTNGVFEVIMNAVKSFGVSFDDALNSLVTDESERDIYRRMHEESQKS